MPLVKKSQKKSHKYPSHKKNRHTHSQRRNNRSSHNFSRHQFSRHTRWGHGTATVQDCCSVSLGEPALTPLKATEFTSMNMDLDKVTISRWSLAEVAWGGEQVHRGQDVQCSCCPLRATSMQCWQVGRQVSRGVLVTCPPSLSTLLWSWRWFTECTNIC